jgi:segregation and condensation protein A
LSDYRVNLDIFAGPMDLLLYLIRKEEVDIYDIPIFKITEQYLQYIEMLKKLDMDLAGDFLVMAATLMQIKSAMLLPAADTENVAGEDLSDPRTELIRQLLEYRKFKDAANLLDGVASDQLMRYPRPDTIIEKLKPGAEPEIDLEQVSVWDLLEAFDAIVAATGGAAMDIRHIVDDTPIDLYQIEILHRLQTEGPMGFSDIFASRNNRIAMIGLFLAMLELIRDKLIWVEQSAPLAPIYLKALTDEPAEQAVQKAIFTSNNEIENEQSPQQEELPVVSVETIEEGQVQVAIVELPPKTENESKEEHEVLGGIEHQLPIAITELPAKGGLIPSTEPEKEETEMMN